MLDIFEQEVQNWITTRTKAYRLEIIRNNVFTTAFYHSVKVSSELSAQLQEKEGRFQKVSPKPKSEPLFRLYSENHVEQLFLEIKAEI